MKLTKIVAVRMQIDTAVRLFFEDADPIASHTLAWAAHDTLEAIWRGTQRRTGGNQLSIMQQVESVAKPEHLEEFRTLKKKAYNFFKHGSRDAHAILEDFDDRQTDIILFAAIHTYIELQKGCTAKMALFMAWFVITYPNLVRLQEEAQAFIAVAKKLEGKPRDQLERFSTQCTL